VCHEVLRLSKVASSYGSAASIALVLVEDEVIACGGLWVIGPEEAWDAVGVCEVKGVVCCSGLIKGIQGDTDEQLRMLRVLGKDGEVSHGISPSL
jgi:hypothetical protein